MQSSFRPLAAVCSERNIDSSEPSFPRLPPPNQPNSPIRLFCLPICQAVRGALHWWAGSTPPAVRTGAHAFRQTEGAVKEIGVGGKQIGHRCSWIRVRFARPRACKCGHAVGRGRVNVLRNVLRVVPAW